MFFHVARVLLQGSDLGASLRDDSAVGLEEGEACLDAGRGM